MKVGVILPSRGLLFSRTADEILQNVKGIPHKIYFSHKKPIPDCFEEPTTAALADGDITHLWFVEDDMRLPSNILELMLDKDLAAVTVDYPVSKDGRGAVFEVDKRVVFGGTGCLLVKREVFEDLRPPYFRTDIKWNAKNYKEFIKMTGVKVKDNEGYGLHDVNFYMNLYRRNIPVHNLGVRVGQRKLVALGKAGTNDGAHNIEVWTKIKKDWRLKQIKKLPIEKTGNLVEVNTPTGVITTSRSHADKLVGLGKAEHLPKRSLVVDDSEIL